MEYEQVEPQGVEHRISHEWELLIAMNNCFYSKTHHLRHVGWDSCSDLMHGYKVATLPTKLHVHC